MRTTTNLLFAGCLILGVTACAELDMDSDLGSESQAAAPHPGYIVVLQQGASARGIANSHAASHGIAVGHVYNRTLNGFSFRGSQAAADALAARSDVLYVEVDEEVHAVGKPPWAGGGGGEEPAAGQTTPWGITRVGGPSDGTGLTAWVIDSGIDLDHPDLNVDVARSANFVTKGKDSADDGNGHGTHVAGTIAAIQNDIGVVGVAAGANVVAVRVLDNNGSGSISGVIAGVEYVAANAAPGDVANMSLGADGHIQSLHTAIVNAANSGVTFALAAGNEADPVSEHEPADVEHDNVYTVSAIDENDNFASFSNYGATVDYAAPGVSILSLAKGGGTTTMSGTSMATPHVAGLLLLGTLKADGFANGDPDNIPDPIAHK